VVSLAIGVWFDDVNGSNSMTRSGITNIGDYAFRDCALSAIAIPDSVIRLGDAAFYACTSLTDATIGKGVTSIGNWCFKQCSTLTNLTVGNSVNSIGDYAFNACTHLRSVTIPVTVSFIGEEGFGGCQSLAAIYFQGDAPTLGGGYTFDQDSTTIYYLPGRNGWSANFGGLPTALWYLPNPVILNTGFTPGDQTNAFGFIVSWGTNIPVVVEACTDLGISNWAPICTNALTTNGWFYFSDQDWTNYPARLYRIRSP
jgi:hypothetical protein